MFKWFQKSKPQFTATEKLAGIPRVVSVELRHHFRPTKEPESGNLAPELTTGRLVKEIGPPLSTERRNDALEWIAAPLPDDYQRLIETANRFVINQWKVLALESVFESPGWDGCFVAVIDAVYEIS